MANIPNFIDIYNTKGKDFFSNLVNFGLTVYEKLDGNNFGLKVGDKGINFFKKRFTDSIGTIERTLTKMYEYPIDHIKTKMDVIREHLDDGYSVGFIFFPDTKSVYIEYDNLPKNQLVLSYVEDENGDKIDDVDYLNYVADLLEVNRPPILFQGKLDYEQLSQVYTYLSMTTDEIKLEYGEVNFTKFILSVLSEDLKRTTLNNNMKNNIEGFIFKFSNSDETFYSKLINPYFENIVSQNRVDYTLDDNYYLILLDIINFVKTVDLNSIPLKSELFGDRYLELISKIYNQFIKTKGSDYDEIQFNTPKYLKRDMNKLNMKNITNNTTLNNILFSKNYEELFRIMLASFRRKRDIKNDLFNSYINKTYKQLVEDIINKCAFDVEDGLNEGFIHFPEFRDIYIYGKSSEDILGFDLENYLRETPKEIVEFLESNFDINNFMKSVFVKTEKRRIRSDENRKPVNLIIDTFDPMSNTVYDLCTYLYESTSIPFLIVACETGNPAYETIVLSKILETLKDHIMFQDFVMVKRPNIEKIINMFSGKYEVNRIFASSIFKSMIDVQLVANYKDNNYMNLKKDYKSVAEYYAHDKNLEVRTNDALAKNNFPEFKKLVPTVYSNLYGDIIKNYSLNFKK